MAPLGPEKDAKPQILVVKDDERTCEVILRLLEHHCRVTCVEGGAADAVNTARDQAFDAVLVVMRRGGRARGVEVLRALRAEERCRTLPIVAVTAFKRPGDTRRFLSRGFNAYLPKPFSEELLIEVLAESIWRS